MAHELSHCAAIEENEARLYCYDELAKRQKSPAKQRDLLPSEESPTLTTTLKKEQNQIDVKPITGNQREVSKRGPWLGIKPYRRNYILPISYNDRVNNTTTEDTVDNFQIEEVEVKFQLSFELPIWEQILYNDLDLYFAYTQLSFFQAYNKEYSSPFRETVYEPELGLNWQPDLALMDWRLSSARLTLNHQSNGRSEPLSRSWNRLIGQFQLENDNLGLGLRLWTRLAEGGEDDNPDIIDYLGHGEFFAGYDIGRHRIGLMLRNPFEHAAVQVGWSYLLNDRVRFYTQYFNGYGESLIDYDQQVNRIGIGFLMNEWP